MNRIERKLIAQIAVLVFALSLINGMTMAQTTSAGSAMSAAQSMADKLDINTG